MFRKHLGPAKVGKSLGRKFDFLASFQLTAYPIEIADNDSPRHRVDNEVMRRQEQAGRSALTHLEPDRAKHWSVFNVETRLSIACDSLHLSLLRRRS